MNLLLSVAISFCKHFSNFSVSYWVSDALVCDIDFDICDLLLEEFTAPFYAVEQETCTHYGSVLCLLVDYLCYSSMKGQGVSSLETSVNS
jgi:hypothetical protein